MDWLLGAIKRFATQTPNSIAVAEDEQLVSYSSLENASNGLSIEFRRRSQACGSGPVAYLGSTSIDLVIALIAAHKAAIPFVALDPRFPNEALRRMARQVDSSIMCTGSENADRAETLGFAPIPISTYARQQTSVDDQHIPFDVDSGRVSHFRFTSGSTAKPKVVPVHCNHLESMVAIFDRLLERRRSDRYGLFGHFWPLVIFRALSIGASLDCIDFPTKGTRNVQDWMRERRVSVMFTYPPLFRQLTADHQCRFPDLRFVHLSGEQLIHDDIVRFERSCPPGAILHNSYGSTEVPWIAGYIHTHGDQVPYQTLPVGELVCPREVCLLGKDATEVAAGEYGEVVVTNDWTGATPFHTGDLGYIDTTGKLHLVGRTDDQLKIRATRINPLQVEMALNQHRDIDECAVFGFQLDNGDQCLGCCFVPGRDVSPSGRDLREFLTDSIPPFMIPDHYFLVNSLPRTANGKLCRRDLAPPLAARPQAQVAVSEDFAKGDQLGRIWADVLGHHRFRSTDSFFDVGGNSLSAMAMLSAVEREFGIRIQPAYFASGTPSITRLKKLMRANQCVESIDDLVQLHPDAKGPELYTTATVGGILAYYSALAEALRENRQLVGLQSRTAMVGDEKQSRIEDLAHENIDVLRMRGLNRVELLGYSFGALIAFEMAHHLSTTADPPTRLILIDPPVTWVRSIAARRVAQSFLTSGDQLSILKRFLKVSSTILGRSASCVTSAHTAAALRYKPKQLELDRVLLVVSADGRDRESILRHWPAVISGELAIVETPGDHVSAMRGPHVMHLAREIEDWLES